MISPITSSLDLSEAKLSKRFSPIYISLLMKAPLNCGLSDFFLKSLIIFAGALATSEIKIDEFPLRTEGQSPYSLSEASIAFSNRVFLTTSNLIPALKQALLKFEVVSASNPEVSAIYTMFASANFAVKSSIAIDFSSLVIIKFVNYQLYGFRI
jgi:hypothetical protein